MEIWKDIPGYEGLYQSSNLGNIRSLDRCVGGKNGKRLIRGIELRKDLNKSGYYYVSLRKNGKKKGCRVHRLVMLAFIPNPENKPQVNHKNGIKADNTLENLEWCTASENELHSYNILGKKTKGAKFWLGKFGKEHQKSKKVKQYNLKGEFIKIWDSTMDIQRQLGINQAAISLICNGKQKSTRGFIFKYI